MIIWPISDMDLVKETFTKPYIWPYITDDLCDIDTFEPIAPSGTDLMYLGVFAPEYGGLFMIHRSNCVTYEIHTILEKNCRGKKAIQAAKNVIDWIFSNTECLRLITQIPEDNLLAERLAISAGMKLYGVNENSFKLKNNVQSLKLYGISKR